MRASGLQSEVSKSAQIRDLFREGLPVAEIARALNIRYQHAYKVCHDAGLLSADRQGSRRAPNSTPTTKPILTTEVLCSGGFVDAGKWVADTAKLICPAGLPRSCGVYAFSIGEEVVYVGLASRSLAQRLYLYGNPGRSQRTNIRLNGFINEAIAAGDEVVIHYACPPNFEWNDFLVSGPEGLEAGIIASYFLPWNVRGA